MGAAVAVVIALGALVGGLILGWVLAGRTRGPVKSERDQARTDADAARLKLNEALVNLAGEAEKNKRADMLEAQLSAEREAVATLRADVAAFRSREEEREKSYEQQVAMLKDARDTLSGQFQEIAGKLL